jgi:hypothetical protein
MLHVCAIIRLAGARMLAGLSRQVARCLYVDFGFSGAESIFHNFQRELSGRARTLEGEMAAVLGYQGLKPCEFSAPDRFDVAVSARIPRLGRVTERNGPYLQEI